MQIRQPDGRWFNDIRFNPKSKESQKIINDMKSRGKLKFNKHYTAIYIINKTKEITVGTSDDNDIILNSRERHKKDINPKHYFIIYKKWGKWKIKVINKEFNIKIHGEAFKQPRKVKYNQIENFHNGIMLVLADETHLHVEQDFFTNHIS